jgi:BirA family biotin operon repressor/biotin-[acetyl-CoA-carboxylase] ligase
MFTVILRYGAIAAIPKAITLKTGLALAAAVEDFDPLLKGRVTVKWPNDLMIGSRKAAGILTEADSGTVYIGVGVNLAQKEFPQEIRAKAVSLLLARETIAAGNSNTVDGKYDSVFTAPELSEGAAFLLLEAILLRLHGELAAGVPAAGSGSWRERLTARLYRKGERVRFLSGGADAGEAVEGVLAGIGEDGELLIVSDGDDEPHAFITGELAVYAEEFLTAKSNGTIGS